MSGVQQLALVAGLFGVPLALLIAGHRFRRSSSRRRNMFWGALIGHVLGACLALIASVSPPIGWLSSDVFRGAIGVWGLLALPLVGATLGVITRSGD